MFRYSGCSYHINSGNKREKQNQLKFNQLEVLIRTILIYLLARNFRNKYAFA
ncbi:hypothetical protein AB46_3605 [Escherichia coli 3-267-03_S1_C2]|nr:hypothetical protein AB46_3605 [Escherichia coli 3-267-03_S1_C2]